MTRAILLISGILSCLFSFSQQVQINGSYLNVSRPSGGPIAPGDILELHSVISVNSGTTVSNLSYTDNIPSGAAFVNGSLKVVTNENKVISTISNTGSYTDAADADRGKIVSSAITINMGTGATSSAGGTVTGASTTPVFQTNTSILMVAYQVTVTAAFGSTITTAGTFHYKTGGSIFNTDVTPATLAVSPFYACSSPGTTNYITQESGGTFNKGSVLNRSTSSASVTGYTFQNLGANAPVDGQYSIVNNTSPTSYTGTSPKTSDKVFGVWDILGDHTGAANPATGNSPTVKKKTGGYLLAVNATYTPAVVFTTTISGLTANSIYTISLWVRNICPKCGNDPATGASTSGSGVNPNLAINLNGNNYYSSGDITYTGQWVQKSFTFQNGSSSTAALDVRNNAPGGGGNDWALDDITMTQCLLVLPIELEAFTGTPTVQGSLLEWQLAPSPELQSFMIERSTDGTNFLPVGEQAAFPDSTHYQFTDRLLPSPGATLFYRIKMVKFDGTTSYSNIVVLRTTSNTGILTTSLVPNPARTSTTLVIRSTSSGPARILFLNTAGTILYSRSVVINAGTNTVDLSVPAHLPAGIYIVRTSTASESSVSRLIAY
ncbi:MAG TPA: T9SS type A sorting domain-containing protein [Puia sp.]|jgi:hypothetical protein